MALTEQTHPDKQAIGTRLHIGAKTEQTIALLDRQVVSWEGETGMSTLMGSYLIGKPLFFEMTPRHTIP